MLSAAIPDCLRRTIGSTLSLSLFFKDPATPPFYTLSLHDALPISAPPLHRSIAVTAHSMRVSGRRAGQSSAPGDRKSTRLNSSHGYISYAVFCLKKKTREAPPVVVEESRSPPVEVLVGG